MLRAIVVDDELMIRQGISSFISNSRTGFEVTGVFPDGSDAIEFLENNDVELVISDVKMVNVSGIELAEYIYETKPYIKVILLSGYAEFEYAKAAIKYNVSDYITKPTDFAEFRNILLSTAETLKRQKNSSIDTFLDDTKQFYADLISCDAKKAYETFLCLFDRYSHAPEGLGQYVSNIFEIIADRLYVTFKINIDTDNEKANYKSLPPLSDRDEIIERSKNIIDNIIALIPQKHDKTEDIIVSKIIQFINEHFGENISLQDAADKVFFNPAYCSRFFKKQTGENFSDYLLKVRMEHAAKLLSENKRISDISAECGYLNPSYFTRVFKNFYNCTPNEYIRNL